VGPSHPPGFIHNKNTLNEGFKKLEALQRVVFLILLSLPLPLPQVNTPQEFIFKHPNL
jgi:hypothetical protein